MWMEKSQTLVQTKVWLFSFKGKKGGWMKIGLFEILWEIAYGDYIYVEKDLKGEC